MFSVQLNIVSVLNTTKHSKCSDYSQILNPIEQQMHFLAFLPRVKVCVRSPFCVHQTTMHQFAVLLHSKPHVQVPVCLAVTSNCIFWQNDCDLSRAAAVIRKWNGYRNKSQHRKLTLEKKILPQLLQMIRALDLSVTSWAL